MMKLNEPANAAGDMSPVRMLSDIEAMIRRDGARQYTANDSDQGFYRAHLCGVKAYLVPKSGMKRMYTPDTDVILGVDGHLSFSKGNLMSLKRWHGHLMAWGQSIRSTSGVSSSTKAA